MSINEKGGPSKSFADQLKQQEKQHVKWLMSVIKKGESPPENTPPHLLEKAGKKLAKKGHPNEYYDASKDMHPIDILLAPPSASPMIAKEDAEGFMKKVFSGDVNQAFGSSGPKKSTMMEEMMKQQQQQAEQLTAKYYEDLKKKADTIMHKSVWEKTPSNEDVDKEICEVSVQVSPPVEDVKLDILSVESGEHLSVGHHYTHNHPLNHFEEYDFRELQEDEEKREAFFEMLSRKAGFKVRAIAWGEQIGWMAYSYDIEYNRPHHKLIWSSWRKAGGAALCRDDRFLRILNYDITMVPPVGVNQEESTLVLRYPRDPKKWWVYPSFVELRTRRKSA